MERKRIELLAPAGDLDIAKAAINAGADAVYIGGKWSARAYAKNFTLEEIEELVRYAHLRDRKVYVALNIMLKNSEIPEALEYTGKLQDIKVDAIIASDLGYIREVGKSFQIPIHASTQLSTYSKQGAEFLKSLNVTRIVPARECSREEVSEIKKAGLETEVFCHGALCSSVSGACIISGMISDRSGNRGTCAQICRQRFLYDGKEKNYLSTKDLCTLGLLEKFREMGIDSLKIEGRMKSRSYVVNTVRAYRELLDKKNSDVKKLQDEMKITFNRGGFTEGYLKGNAFIDYIEDNSHQGLKVGKVMSQGKGFLEFSSCYPISEGDSIEIGGKGFRAEKLTFSNGVARLKSDMSFEKGQDVFLKQSAALLQQEEEYSKDTFKREVDLSFECDEKGLMSLSAQSEGYIACINEYAREKSRKDIDISRIRDSLSKTGGTICSPGKIEIDIKGNPFISVSALNSMRREVLGMMDEAVLRSFKYQGKKELEAEHKERKEHKRYIAVQTDDISLIERLDRKKAERIYFVPRKKEDFSALENTDPKGIYIVIPPFLSLKSLGFMEGFLKGYRPEGIVAGNFNSMFLGKEMDMRVVTDYWQNVSNSLSAELICSYGADEVSYSAECDFANLRSFGDIPMEVTVYGKMDLMNMYHFITGFGQEDILNDKIVLGNRDSSFQIKNSYYGEQYLRVCNGKKLYINDFKKLRTDCIRGIRLICSGENEFSEVLQYYYDGFISGLSPDPVKTDNYTRGHFAKGVD